MTNIKKIDAIFVDGAGTIFKNAPKETLGVELYEDAYDLITLFLNRLTNKTNFKTGLITNWGNKVHTFVETMDIKNYFDIIISSDDVSFAKPASEPFIKACRLVNVLPQNALYIGDSLYDDALGAYDAGLQSIWLNRNQSRFLTKDEEKMIGLLQHPVHYNLSSVVTYLKDFI